jgi:hypothetical protein
LEAVAHQSEFCVSWMIHNKLLSSLIKIFLALPSKNTDIFTITF